MNICRTDDTILIEAARYSAQIMLADPSAMLLAREGMPLLRLPLVSGLAPFAGEEHLQEIRITNADLIAREHLVITLSAASDCWVSRSFQWHLYDDHLTFQQFAEGQGRLGRCFFFSNGIGGPWGTPGIPGVEHQTTVFTRRCFAPGVNHANRFFYDIAEPQALGVRDDSLRRATDQSTSDLFLPAQIGGLFCPPPLALVFGDDSAWVSVGLGEHPGRYLFNALDYSGARLQGAAFSVDYLGYHSVVGQFASPMMALHFGFSPYEALEHYTAWADQQGCTTQRRFPNAAWHQEPIFCAWAEQTVVGRSTGVSPADLATQANYEAWIAVIEQRGIPFGTLVIDDKWQEHYGSFEIDRRKWPDMPGFIARQHAQGRHVLLWVPAHHPEGLPPALCVCDGDRPIAGDVTNPAYEQLLRNQIRRLMTEVGADGFKEDWLSGVTSRPDVRMHSPLHGIEFVRHFQHILYDEAHACKADALIETQTPNPLFRESSDVLRLNDLWFATRDVVTVMRTRARIARIAGWPLVDCDNASATCLSEWWAYTQAHPSIGIPALYFVTKMESTDERPSDDQWAYLAALWQRYRTERGLNNKPPNA